MGTDKIIRKAVFSTLAAIAVLFVFMVAMLVTFYPSTMMGLTYDLGMDSASVHFARRAYKGSGDIYYIAYATEVSIGMDDSDKIETCGEKFIADSEFEEYCAHKNEAINGEMSYEQYIYGKVCVAKYEQGKTQDAVDSAFEWNGGEFTRNNATVAVLYTAMQSGDFETVALIKTELQALQTTPLNSSELTYLQSVLSFIDQYANN